MGHVIHDSCKFYRAGQCWHVDAPESNRDCIGADACDAQYDRLIDCLRDNAPEREVNTWFKAAIRDDNV